MDSGVRGNDTEKGQSHRPIPVIPAYAGIHLRASPRQPPRGRTRGTTLDAVMARPDPAIRPLRRKCRGCCEAGWVPGSGPGMTSERWRMVAEKTAPSNKPGLPKRWIPASAGMTPRNWQGRSPPPTVIPAYAGIHLRASPRQPSRGRTSGTTPSAVMAGPDPAIRPLRRKCRGCCEAGWVPGSGLGMTAERWRMVAEKTAPRISRDFRKDGFPRPRE